MVKMGQIKSIVILLLAISLSLSLLWVAKKHATLLCQQIKIQIKDHPDQSFIAEKDILDLLKATDKMALLGTPLKKISSYNIKKQLERQPLIKNVLVFKTCTGTLNICLETKRVLARIISPTGPNNTQTYVDENGNLISIQGLPLFRVLLISSENITTEVDGFQTCNKELLELLYNLHIDPFFCYQITSLQVENNHKITLGTQVGNHQIEFGRADNIHKKLQKLRLFYSQVIPYKGWNAYHRINLEFENQLICE